ncbi:heavy metal translocating P-type ATPase [Mycobacterium sherrisii]|uniref:heavy metal translocating P-type ATPase n=1 Tax=Mycobacterium sherrisii TaxID=243061 RepID=UPI00398E8FE1
MSCATVQAMPTPSVARPKHSGLWSLAAVRWASAAVLLFLAGLTAQLLGAPAWSWWACYLACYLTGGWQPAREGLQALRSRALDVDLLMVVAAVGAAGIGQIVDGALLIVIFATSGALEDAATKRTEDSVRGLLDLAPSRAVRIGADGIEESVDADTLRVGDVVSVRPGERIAADGVVVEGASEVDQSSVTGEPLPVGKTVDDDVLAGTLNTAGALRIRVTNDPSDTVVARIVALVARASASKATTQLFIEKVEQRYSVGVVAATVALFTVPLVAGAAFQPTLLRAMTFMIVASPCAVVLATMPPLLCAIANAGRHGVLVKSAVAIEHLADTTQVTIDKTGTLTTGSPRLAGITILDDRYSEHAVLRIAASAEQFSEHPLGRAIVGAAHARGLTVSGAADFRALPGRGVRARVGEQTVEVLSPRAAPARLPGVGELERDGITAVLVLVDGRAVGVLGLDDTVRLGTDSVIRTIATLTSAPPVLLTGDAQPTAEHLAAQVGITDVRANLLPDDKVAAVRRLAADGHRVLFVGDGINDAPAMACAHSSIAMGRNGADLTLDTADAVTVRDELATIPAVLTLARRARRVVIANLFIAATFIVGLVAADLVGDLPLPLGVAGHEGSAVIVALNGLQLLRNRAWGPTISWAT